MITTAKLKLPDGGEISLQYPGSPLMDVVAREILEGKEYPVMDFLGTAGSVILDIGANVGCSSVFFAIHYPKAIIYAFEPAREAFEFLSRNTARFANVRLYPIGISDRDGTADFFHGRNGSVTNSLFANSGTSNSAAETIQLRRMSSFVREQSISHVSIMKLDTEGAEIAILRDLADFLGCIDAIFVEYHSDADRREIDAILAPHFSLCQGHVAMAHRGLFIYIANRLVETMGWHRLAIIRPKV